MHLVILILRIYAVYNCSRRLLLIMIAFLVAAIASSSWLGISTLATGEYLLHFCPFFPVHLLTTIQSHW
ncbi:hypothetical protein JB92DRAFT_3041039 [Gautieria morchelliformis]|nr:hypothetical protein JB92DRAFT_3041039 [Gautieria morchelliformis]